MLDEAEGHRRAWSSPRPITCTRVIALAAMDLGKHVYVQKPLTWSVDEARQLAQEGRRDEGHDADGQPGPLVRRCARWSNEYIQAGAIGDVTRGARLDQPSARLTGRRAFRGRRRCTTAGRRAALEHARRHGAPRRRDGRHTTRCPTGWPGICSSVRRRTSSTTRSTTRSTGAAGSTGACGAHRRHGRASDRSRRSGRSTSAIPTTHRNRLDAVQQGVAFPHGHDDLLRVRGARRAGRR